MKSRSGKAKLEKVRDVYRFWGRNPAIYRLSDRLTFLGRAKTIRGRAVSGLGLFPNDRVLEVGCGTGRNLGFLQQAVGATGRVTGLDYSRDMLDAARRLAGKNGWKNMDFVEADARKMELAPESLDGALSILAISAIPEEPGLGWRDALRLVYRALKPGAVLSVCDARLFEGKMAALNPLVEWGYDRWAAWDPGRKIPAEMERVFGNVAMENFNWGTFYIARSKKR